MTLIYLYEIEHYNPATAQVEVLKVSNTGYIDPLTGDGYSKRLKRGGAARFGTFAYDRGTTFGRSTVGDGEIILVNTDREYDELRDHDFRKVTIRSLQNRNQLLTDAVMVAELAVESTSVTWTELRIGTTDRLGLLNLPVQRATFAGNNVDADDTEGNASIQGRIKPVLIGKTWWFEPIMVNTASLLFVINHDKNGVPKAVQSIDGVKDNGVNITFHANYTTIALLVAAQTGGSIPAGKYGTCLAQGAFALNNATPSGVVTCKATEASSNTAAQCVKRMIIASTDFVIGDFEGDSALDTSSPAPVGIYIDGATTLLEATEMLLGSIGAFMTPTLSGKLRFGKLINPASEIESITFEKNSIIRNSDGGIERIPLSDVTGGIPIHKMVVNYAKYQRQLGENDIAGSVAVAERQDLQQAFRSVTAEDASVLVQYLQSEPLTIDTALHLKADAESFAAVQLAMRKIWRDMFVISVESKYSINIGDIVRLKLAGFGLESGKNFIALGYELDLNREVATYYLYG